MTENESALAIRRQAEEEAALFPALLIEAERIAQTITAGLHGRRRAGPGETFWQHRAYAFGDPVSAIDWRQSARMSDRLYVRENEWEASAAVYLWRDPSKSLDYSSRKTIPTKRRRADVLSVALTILLSEAGERIGLLGEARRPFYGRSAPSRLLESLEVDQFNDAASIPPPAHLSPGARVIMLSDFFADPGALENAVTKFASAGASGALVQICDPAEEEFPFQGRVEFRDLESADRLIFGETGALKDDYQARFSAHRHALTALAQKTGWTLITHRTDKPPQTALLSLFSALGDIRNWKQ